MQQTVETNTKELQQNLVSRKLSQTKNLLVQAISVENCSILIRLILSAAVNYYLSSAIFSKKNVPQIEKAFHSFFDPEGFFAEDAYRLDKMHRLWPARDEPYLYLAYSTVIYMNLRFFDSSTMESVLFPSKDRLPPFVRRFVCSSAYVIVQAVVFFSLLLPMYRIGEFNILIIIINFLHILASVGIVQLVMSLHFIKEDEPKSKED